MSTNSGDAFYIEELRIYKDGNVVKHEGHDDGSGWCLSVDTNDYQMGWEGKVAGGSCRSSFKFNL